MGPKHRLACQIENHGKDEMVQDLVLKSRDCVCLMAMCCYSWFSGQHGAAGGKLGAAPADPFVQEARRRGSWGLHTPVARGTAMQVVLLAVCRQRMLFWTWRDPRAALLPLPLVV